MRTIKLLYLQQNEFRAIAVWYWSISNNEIGSIYYVENK